MVTKEHLKNLASRRDKLYKFLDIANKKTQANTLEQTTQSTDLWEDPKKAQIILKQLRTFF